MAKKGSKPKPGTKPGPVAKPGTPSAQAAAAASKDLRGKGKSIAVTAATKGTPDGPLPPQGSDPLGPPQPKPTVKQLIGGASWTGKLPVNLFNEYCQKQKWDRPEYDTRKTPDGFSCFVTISAKDPKTNEQMRLDPFKLPPSHKHLVCRPTALEAKHCAATYALFRVCSMQNRHSVLPPDYKALWKDFQALKSIDVKEQKGWMYDADPFRTYQARQESKAAAEKKRSELEAAKAKAKAMPGASGLVLLSNADGAGRQTNLMKGWTNIPRIEMGKKSRANLEALLRKASKWNPHNVELSKPTKERIVADLSKIGFRKSHVEEAVEYCKDREETLEWLMIHVPEDDLPPWALPEHYAAGISVAATDLKKEATIKRLAETGYSIELCRQVLEQSGDEGRAAEELQRILLGKTAEDDETPSIPPNTSQDEHWNEEIQSLESVFGDQFSQPAPDVIEIQIPGIEAHVPGRPGHVKESIEAVLRVRRSPNYPAHIILGVVAKLPAYVKLCIVKKALEYVQESLADEPMKLFLVVDWLEHNMNDIISHPGKLLDISSVSSAASEPAVASQNRKPRRPRTTRPPAPIKWTPDERTKEEWKRRQNSSGWQNMVSKRQKLPAWGVREDIIETVEHNNVTIISGETGSGKSTQSMQFILDDLYSRGLGQCANIIVTQPRRISALGLADRVAEERCATVGGEVGYAIRGESRRGPDTRITFVTTGVLLRRLQVSGGHIEDVVASIADVSHIVVDEVHERSLDTDFLLTILREVLVMSKGQLKLVLMSATLDAASFENYFAAEGLRVGMVEIEGRTWPVEDQYLDDVVHFSGFDPNSADDMYSRGESVGKTIQKIGHRINYNLILATVRAIDDELSDKKQTGGVLVFLPGVGEINHACNLLRSVTSLHVLSLHASLETKEQKRVFAPPPPGKRKVVVATNVAETSITIDDIVAVVDSGKVKETTFDPQNNMRKLEETWVSLAAAKQRRGRAGRVQAGKCYKLYTRNLEAQMAARPEPEIRRVPLEQLCLSVRAMGIRDVAAFLGRSPTPPESQAVEGAISLLRRMGALDGEELTALGQQLAMIPADLRCSKLMVYGNIFNCLDDTVTIAAILSTKSPFVSPAEKRDAAKEARMYFSTGEGDLLTALNAYHEWNNLTQDRVPQRHIRSFCEENFLSFQTLSDISNTRTQFYSALVEAGVIPTTSSSPQNPPQTNTSLLRALTASAFAPQIARIQFPDKKFASSMSGAVELDPEARMIRYFTQEHGRVFVHPSSTLFDSQGFAGGAAYMSYFSLIATSKTFIRDLTPFNSYTLLLFAGTIELDTLGRGLTVDTWLRLRGWARIGVLVSRLRGMLDAVVAGRVDGTPAEHEEEVIRTVVRLVELDGLDA